MGQLAWCMLQQAPRDLILSKVDARDQHPRMCSPLHVCFKHVCSYTQTLTDTKESKINLNNLQKP